MFHLFIETDFESKRRGKSKKKGKEVRKREEENGRNRI